MTGRASAEYALTSTRVAVRSQGLHSAAGQISNIEKLFDRLVDAIE
jgi:hypothetical protein